MEASPCPVGNAELEEVNDGWSGTRLVRLRRAAPGAVRVEDDALPASLASEVYDHTLAQGRSWGTYVTLAEAGGEAPLEAGERDLAARVASLVAQDSRVGFPAQEPGVRANPHGWFFPAHRVVMANLMSSDTTCVLELGSWLGKSTRFIAERAPNAFVFAVDLWSNDHIRADPAT